VEGQDLAYDQSADNRDAERTAQFGTFAKVDRQRHCPQGRRHRGHHDRTEALQAGFVDRFAQLKLKAALGIEREIDQYDLVLFDDPDQQDDAIIAIMLNSVPVAISASTMPLPADGRVARSSLAAEG